MNSKLTHVEIEIAEGIERSVARGEVREESLLDRRGGEGTGDWKMGELEGECPAKNSLPFRESGVRNMVCFTTSASKLTNVLKR